MNKLLCFFILCLITVGGSGQNNMTGYEYWFDMNYESKVGGSMTSSQLDMVVPTTDLPEGIHFISFRAKDSNGLWSSASSQYFYKQGPEKVPNQMTGYEYWFDMNYGSKVSGSMTSPDFAMNIPTDDLNYGMHYLNFRAVDKRGSWSSSVNQYFYKPKPSVDNKICAYEYWFNKDYEQKTLVEVDTVNPFILTNQVIPIQGIALQQNPQNYRFTVDPYGIDTINHVNDVVFRIRFKDITGNWGGVESDSLQLTYREIAKFDTLQSGTDEPLTFATAHQMLYYKGTFQAGDSLIYSFSKNVKMDVYNAYGKKVFVMDGTTSANGFRPNRDGTYYCVVYAANAKDLTSVMHFVNIPKYSVVSWSPQRIGNTGFLNMKLYGNGFDTRTKVTILRRDSDDILPDTLLITDLSNMEARFNLDQAPIGWMDLKVMYGDTTIYLKDAIEVQPNDDQPLDIKILGNTWVLKGSEQSYVVEITNNGNVSKQQSEIDVLVKSEGSEAEVGSNAYSHIDKMFMDALGRNVRTNTFENIGDIDGDGTSNKYGQFYIPNLGPGESAKLIVTVKGNGNNVIKAGENANGGWGKFLDALYYLDKDPKDRPILSLDDFCSFGGNQCYDEIMGEVRNTLMKEALNDFVFSVLGEYNPVPIAGSINDVFGITDQALYMAENNGSLDGYSDGVNDPRFGKLYSGSLETMKYGLDWQLSITEMNNEVKNGMSLAVAKQPKTKLKKTVTKKSFNPLKPDWKELVGKAIAYGGTYWWQSNKAKDLCLTSSIKGCNSFPENSAKLHVYRVRSFDPNNKVGFRSASGSTYFNDDSQRFTYLINFENDSLATAPAHEVYVRDTLDATKFDLHSFNADFIKIGDHAYDAPVNVQNHKWTIDMRPEKNLITEVSLNYDETTGIIEWHFSTIDPQTDEKTTAAEDGFLPPNVDGIEGQGTVAFSIHILGEMDEGISVDNHAVILFDDNEPVFTNNWGNTKDVTSPVSLVVGATDLTENTSEIFWSATDKGSGVYRYDLYMKTEGSDAFTKVLDKSETNRYSLTFEYGKKYDFYVIATDSAMNVEQKDPVSEFTFIRQNVTGVTLTPASVVLSVGETATLTATVEPSGALNKNVTWKSSDPNVATVSSTGIVTARMAGSTIVTVTTEDGSKTATCSVTVKESGSTIIYVTSVTLTPTNLVLSLGDTAVLTAKVFPSEAANKDVTWKSSNAAVASVSSTGVVTALSKGTAKITVTTNDSFRTADCAVTVLSDVANEQIDGSLLWTTEGMLHIRLRTPQRIGIYSITGALIKMFDAPVGDTTVPLAKGVYVVKMQDAIEKLIVQ